MPVALDHSFELKHAMEIFDFDFFINFKQNILQITAAAARFERRNLVI